MAGKEHRVPVTPAPLSYYTPEEASKITGIAEEEIAAIQKANRQNPMEAILASCPNCGVNFPQKLPRKRKPLGPTPVYPATLDKAP
jgi:hypothetical protein